MIYDLIGVSNHYGSMSFGHYTAFCYNHYNKDWYEFDDSHVSRVSDPAKVVSEAAYQLFYKRRGFYDDGEVDFSAIKQTLHGTKFAEEQ